MFHPLMRVWIEISSKFNFLWISLFHPLMRVWIEIRNGKANLVSVRFHPLMRVWIEIFSVSDRTDIVYVSPSYEGVD